ERRGGGILMLFIVKFVLMIVVFVYIVLIGNLGIFDSCLRLVALIVFSWWVMACVVGYGLYVGFIRIY
ncbi:hypothetical protein AAHH78_40090, partial [Burkholderia pseudomallei]